MKRMTTTFARRRQPLWDGSDKLQEWTVLGDIEKNGPIVRTSMSKAAPRSVALPRDSE
jgi:hypothetical protein